MQCRIQTFNELSRHELFDIYKLRSRVFVVEQNCAYQDVDDHDLDAYHVCMHEDGKLVGYSRILPPAGEYKNPRIGRVVVSENFRKGGRGKELMKQSLQSALKLFQNEDVVISAQKYLLKFYRDLGFAEEGEEYLEDNIPHIKMRYKK